MILHPFLAPIYDIERRVITETLSTCMSIPNKNTITITILLKSKKEGVCMCVGQILTFTLIILMLLIERRKKQTNKTFAKVKVSSMFTWKIY